MRVGTKLKQAVGIPGVILRLGDESMPAMQRRHEISSWLQLEIYEPAIKNVIEELGRLVCLPVADGEFGLQLAFALQRDDHPDIILLLHIHPGFLGQWPVEQLQRERAFRFDHTAEHELRLDPVLKGILVQLLEATERQEFSNMLHGMELSLQILRKAVEQLSMPFAPCAVPACRFLANDSEREKIHRARAILDAHYDERLTIKDLARKVAMNECYLKKGFKTLTGSTIHEYIAARRITTARHMLQTEGRSVTEVAAVLGYSSISHFSTAFKKATGLKPCELLG